MTWEFIFGRFLTMLLVCQLGLILWNLRVVIRPKAGLPKSNARVSLLIPARNEEGFIGNCLRSLISQDHDNIEIIVLDDHSTDRTRAIIESHGAKVKLVSGKPIPAGWTGKNWACHQLSMQATGDVLFFIDADAILEPAAISSVLSVMRTENVDMVASLLRNQGTSFSVVFFCQSLIMPFSHCFSFSNPSSSNPDMFSLWPFVGVVVLHTTTRVAMLLTDHIVDDVQLARSVKAAGYHQRLINGTDLATTLVFGFGMLERLLKRCGALSYRTSLSLLVTFMVAPLLALPFLRLLAGFFGAPVPMEVLWQVVLLILGRFITSSVGRDPLWGVIFHPFAMLFWGMTLFWSMMIAMTGQSIEWKNRNYTTKPRQRKDLTEEG